MKFYLENFTFPIFDYINCDSVNGGIAYYGVTDFLTFEDEEDNWVFIKDNIMSFARGNTLEYECEIDKLTQWDIQQINGDRETICSVANGYKMFTYTYYEFKNLCGHYYNIRPLVNFIPYEENAMCVTHENDNNFIYYDDNSVITDAQLIANFNELIPLGTLHANNIYRNDRDLPVFVYESMDKLEENYFLVRGMRLNIDRYAGYEFDVATFNSATGELEFTIPNTNNAFSVAIEEVQMSELIFNNPKKAFRIDNQTIFSYKKAIQKTPQLFVFSDVVWNVDALRKTSGGEMTLNVITGDFTINNLINSDEVADVYKSNLYTDKHLYFERKEPEIDIYQL